MIETVTHTINPVFDKRSEVLILGTIPSPKSREEGFYYGNPRNRFWKVLAAVLDEPTPEDIATKRDMLLRHHIALWDVVKSCEIDGAADATIDNPQVNDIYSIVKKSNIETILCTGLTARTLYKRFCEEETGISADLLPSPSPANASWTFEKLVNEYYDVLHLVLPHIQHHILDVADVIDAEKWLVSEGTSLEQLMRRAGTWLAYKAAKYIELHAEKDIGRALIFCGSGNNGGDGWIAADKLLKHNWTVTLVTPKPAEDIRAFPAHTCAVEVQKTLQEYENAQLLVNPTEQQLRAELLQADLAIDALLGTGFSGDDLRAPYEMWVNLINEYAKEDVYVVSADAPSGLNAQTGNASNPCVCADLTVTMIASKTGLYTKEGPYHCGKIEVAPLAYVEEFTTALTQQTIR